MQNRNKKQILSEESPVKGSPYRMGNWTVTQLKDELRSRQLPITGKKAELIDRLENTPVKTIAAPNTNSRESPSKRSKSPLKKLVEDMQMKLLEKRIESPSTERLSAPSVKSPSVTSPSVKSFTDSPSYKSFTDSPSRSPSRSVVDNLIRSRGRSRSPSQGMMTRSRSSSLSRGTFLSWTRQPFSVFGNFVMAQVDLAWENFLFCAALVGLVASVLALVHFNQNYRNTFFDQIGRVAPIAQVFVDGLLSNLGLSGKASEFSQYVSRASRFMFDCSSGNIERNSSTGRLRCSAAPLNFFDFGLPGRLFWLTREHFLSWSAGAVTASLLVFFVTRKARTALPIQTNQTLRKSLNLAARFALILAVFSPFEVVGLVSGFSGLKGSKFAALLAGKLFFALPLQFAFRILTVKNQKFISAQFDRFPIKFPFDFSIAFLARQILNAALYIVIGAAAIQVIANARVYKKHRN